MKLTIVSMFYLFFHFFINLSNHAGIETFELNYQFVKANMIGTNYGLLILLVGFVTLLTYFWQRIGKKELALDRLALPKLTDLHLMSAVLISLAFLDNLTTKLIWEPDFGPSSSRWIYRLVYNTPNNLILAREDFTRLFVDQLFVFVILLVACPLICRGLSLLIKNKTGFSLAFLSSFVLSVLTNYLIQDGITSGRLANTNIVTGAIAFQVLILMLVAMLIYLLINRFVIATVVIVVLFGGFSFANAQKYSQREEPVYLSDVSWLKNPKTLFSFVDTKLLILGLVAIILLVVFAIFMSRKFYRGSLMGWKARVGSLVGIVLIMLPIGQNFSQFSAAEKRVKVPILTYYMDLYNSDILWKGASYTAGTKSLSFSWMRQIFGGEMDKPAQYNKAKVQEVAKKYETLAAQINQTRTEKIEDQTVIYILSESLSNPNRLPDVTVSENPLPNIDAIKNSSTGGIMYSNGYGGGTANMEAQSLTGLPMANFNSNVAVVNADVLPHMDFIPSISNAFENKIAIHAQDASNYNRSLIYKKLGFQHFYALSNTAKSDLLTNQASLDGQVSDQQTYDDILEQINPKQSQFFSVMTMQNHMPYSAYSGDSTLTASADAFDAARNNLLQNYTRKINTTDKATQEFLNQLEKIDKKITVVFYGDHLPSIYTAENFQKSPITQYETDYFIWTNQGNASNSHENINSAEFTPKLLETQNAKVSPYEALLSQVMWNVPAEYNTPIGKTVKLDKSQEAILDDLKIIQYDLTSGQQYLDASSSFYKTK